MHRRTLLQSAAWLTLGIPLAKLSAMAPQAQFSADPFAAGVASGDPTPDGVVLWTRLMPDPAREQDWQRVPISVDWQIANDEGFTRIVRSGRELAQPEFGHSVHVDVNGLQPNRWYWYRFRSGGAVSQAGRTRTAPSGPTDRVRFAFASCQNFQQGHYTAYRNMVREDLDFVVFLGDYIYETGGTVVRAVPREEPRDLTGYRDRYRLYRTDEHLREAHRLFPWIVTWDDHEVKDNYANNVSPDNQSPAEFLKRRAAAYRAHYEWMPLPKVCSPKGPAAHLYRRLSFGPLARLFVLDGRQYRSDQSCGDGSKPPCEEMTAQNRTMLGREQEQWLDRELRGSRAEWNILANQVQMTVVDRAPGPQQIYAMDAWVGYDASRRKIVSSLRDSRVSNPVVFTGDSHSNWVGDLKIDYRDERAPVISSEFVGTSISSGGDGGTTPPDVEAYLRENPQVRFYNNQRGYVRCEVTRRSLVADFRVVERVSTPESEASTAATFIVESGNAGAKKISG